MHRLPQVTHFDVIKTDGRDRFRTLPRNKDQSIFAVEIYRHIYFVFSMLNGQNS